jgi:NAD(P)-dependent dehydrogenase (short-subunit alcohol dehydrogenase family)
MTSLADTAVVVTGGARGLGAVYARALREAGARIVIADRLEGEGEQLAAELSPDGEYAAFVRTDVADDPSATEMARQAVERFGRIDVLVNNAAVYMDIDRKQSFDQLTVEDWDRVMAVNARGTWLCTKAVFPSMRDQGRGKVINVSSSTVKMGIPGFAHYVASKAAVIGLTRALASELGRYGITVNALMPGLVANEASERLSGTEYVEAAPRARALQRAMLPEDLVGALIFLASPGSDFVTGQTLVVDGGAVMS